MPNVSIEWLLSVSIFALVLVITPGPNNVMLTNSGATYGFKKTLPHILGVSLGSPALLIVITVIGSNFVDSGIFKYVFRIVSVLYLSWLAFKIATTKPLQKESYTSRPLNFMQAAGVQWLNPKIWSQYIVALGLYLSSREKFAFKVMIIACIFTVIGIFSCCLWVFFGKLISIYLNKEKHFRIFNISMAVLLILTIVPIIVNGL